MMSMCAAKAFLIPVRSASFVSHILVPSFHLSGRKVRCHPHLICLEHISNAVGFIIVWQRELHCCFRQMLQNRALKPKDGGDK